MARHATILLALCLIAGCAREVEKPNILLLTIDTVRIDHLGCYGGKQGNTPNLDRLAEEGILFQTAYCQAPITRPSHISMLTSLYPRTHGVMHNQLNFSPDPVYLPELLRQSGYQTAAFTGVRLLSAAGGFARGFDHFSFPQEEKRIRHAGETVKEIGVWLEETYAETAAEKTAEMPPLFLWAHFFDAHFPYHYDESIEGFPDLPPYDGPLMTGSWDEIMEAAGDSTLDEASHSRLQTLYTGKIQYLDYWLGKLRERLEQNGMWNDMEVFLLSDHGEGFEKGVYLEHVNSLYNPVSSIAFLWKRPGGVMGGTTVRTPVEEIDLMPTVLAAAGNGIPETAEGKSLFPLLSGDSDERRYTVTEEPPLFQTQLLRLSVNNRYCMPPLAEGSRSPLRASGERLALTDGNWKYIYDSQGEDEFYDLVNDPDEEVNRIDSPAADELPRLRHVLKEWLETHPLPQVDEADSLDAETRELLESLGYL